MERSFGSYERELVRDTFAGLFGRAKGPYSGKVGGAGHMAGSVVHGGLGLFFNNVGPAVEGSTGLLRSGLSGISQDMRALRRGSMDSWRGRRQKHLVQVDEKHRAAMKKWESKGRMGKMPQRQVGLGYRTAGEHLGRGIQNASFTFSRAGLGLNLGLAAMMSSDNAFDPNTGVAKMFAENIAAEQGFVGGMALGAAGATAMWSGGAIGTALLAGGLIGGGLLGAAVGTAAVDAIWETSRIGNRYGKYAASHKSRFVDSDTAYTMRQRAVQSINRSQMSARSAFGNEAAISHI